MKSLEEHEKKIHKSEKIKKKEPQRKKRNKSSGIPKKKRPPVKKEGAEKKETDGKRPREERASRERQRPQRTSNKVPETTKRRKKKKLTKEQIEQQRKQKRKENIIEIIKFIVPILVIATFVFIFILNTSSHMVDGNSMNPTLDNGDKVIVIRTKDPKRYEVITFKPPVKSEYQYVKRVIGMPGDLIWTEGNYLYINAQAESLPESTEYSAASELPDGTIKVDISEKALEQLSELKKIPEDNYFVLGDNRNNSSDSREFGLVDSSSIEGVVSFRFSPLNRIGWIK